MHIEIVRIDLSGALERCERLVAHPDREICAAERIVQLEAVWIERDGLLEQRDAGVSLVLQEALARAGRPDDAASTAAEAFAILEAKGDVAGAAQFKVYLAGVGVEVA